MLEENTTKEPPLSGGKLSASFAYLTSLTLCRLNGASEKSPQAHDHGLPAQEGQKCYTPLSELPAVLAARVVANLGPESGVIAVVGQDLRSCGGVELWHSCYDRASA
jgi:hypothetical protein